MLPDRSVLIGQKLVENAKIQMRHFEYFSSNVEAQWWKMSHFSSNTLKTFLSQENGPKSFKDIFLYSKRHLTTKNESFH